MKHIQKFEKFEYVNEEASISGGFGGDDDPNAKDVDLKTALKDTMEFLRNIFKKKKKSNAEIESKLNQIKSIINDDHK